MSPTTRAGGAPGAAPGGLPQHGPGGVRRITLVATTTGAAVAVAVVLGWWSGTTWLVTWGGPASATPWTVAGLGLVAAAAVVAGTPRLLLVGVAAALSLVVVVAPGAAAVVERLGPGMSVVPATGTALAVVLLAAALAAGPRFAILRVGLVAGAVSLAHTAVVGALLGIDWVVGAAAGAPAGGMSLPTVALVWTAAVAVWTADAARPRLVAQVLAPAVLASAAAPWLVAAIVGGERAALWFAAAATSVTAALTVAMLSYARTHHEVMAGVNRLLEAAPDAMLLVDGRGMVVSANQPAADLFERPVHELVGAGVEALVPAASRTRHRSLRENYGRDPQTRMMRQGKVFRVDRPDGSEVPVSIALAPMRVDGDLQVAVTIRDVSEQEERIQALVRLERMQRLFMSAVSHELRTPLSVVQASAETLAAHRSQLDEETVAQIIDRMSANARRLNDLLTDLLDLQRVERGDLGTSSPIPPDEILDMVTTAGRDVQLDELTVDRHPGCPPVVAEPLLLARALHNLLHNATKYAPGPVEVTLRPVDDGLEIRVEDHGPGVAPRLRPSVFDPFRRGEQHDPATPGVGIGLSLVAGVAGAAGGRAWVDGRADGRPGASFRIWLPGGQGVTTADEVEVSSAER